VYNDYLPSHHVDALLIDARWGAEDLASLQRTLQWAAGHGTRVDLFGPTVEYDAPLPRLLAISIQSKDLSVPRRHMLMENWPLDVQMARLAAGESGVKYISLIAPVCDQFACASYAGEGVPLEFDSNHFTEPGSLIIAQRIKAAGGL